MVRSPAACASTYGVLALRRADAPLGPAPGSTARGVGGGSGSAPAVADLSRFPPEDRDAIKKACADAAALAAAPRSTQAATRARGGSDPWSDELDAALRRAVAAAGPPPKGGVSGYWLTVAATVPNKEPKQCNQRWTKQLDPNISHAPITPEEARIILSERHRDPAPRRHGPQERHEEDGLPHLRSSQYGMRRGQGRAGARRPVHPGGRLPPPPLGGFCSGSGAVRRRRAVAAAARAGRERPARRARRQAALLIGLDLACALLALHAPWTPAAGRSI